MRSKIYIWYTLCMCDADIMEPAKSSNHNVCYPLPLLTPACMVKDLPDMFVQFSCLGWCNKRNLSQDPVGCLLSLMQASFQEQGGGVWVGGAAFSRRLTDRQLL